MNVSLIMNLAGMSNGEIKKFAQKQGILLTEQQINIIRRIIEGASFEWVVTGIPSYVIDQLYVAVGEKNAKKILKLIE